MSTFLTAKDIGLAMVGRLPPEPLRKPGESVAAWLARIGAQSVPETLRKSGEESVAAWLARMPFPGVQPVPAPRPRYRISSIVSTTGFEAGQPRKPKYGPPPGGKWAFIEHFTAIGTFGTRTMRNKWAAVPKDMRIEEARMKHRSREAEKKTYVGMMQLKPSEPASAAPPGSRWVDFGPDPEGRRDTKLRPLHVWKVVAGEPRAEPVAITAEKLPAELVQVARPKKPSKTKYLIPAGIAAAAAAYFLL